jgi:hypothetical protein
LSTQFVYNEHCLKRNGNGALAAAVPVSFLVGCFHKTFWHFFIHHLQHGLTFFQDNIDMTKMNISWSKQCQSGVMIFAVVSFGRRGVCISQASKRGGIVKAIFHGFPWHRPTRQMWTSIIASSGCFFGRSFSHFRRASLAAFGSSFRPHLFFDNHDRLLCSRCSRHLLTKDYYNPSPAAARLPVFALPFIQFLQNFQFIFC